jgi:phospholipid-binding lipoprotein MlaA
VSGCRHRIKAQAAGALLLGLCALALSACAAPSPQALAANDPLEPTNRAIFSLNQWWDHCCLMPTLRRYRNWVPPAGRRGIHNFLGNLNGPITFVNDIAQGEAARGGQTAGRFVINSTLGLGGLLDPASRMGIAAHSEDGGQTLAVWGVEEGPYLMIPLLGPSNPRDVVGIAANVLGDPTNLIPMKQHLWWAGFRQYMVMVDLRSQTLETLEDVERNSVDYYASMRSLYRQVRADQIRNGGPAPVEDLPDL